MQRMQSKRIGALALAASMALSATSTNLFAQDRNAPRGDDARAAARTGRGNYEKAKLSDLPGPAQRAIQERSRGADEVRVWKVTRAGDEEMYEAAFPNKEGVRMVMKVDKTGRVVVPPTELPERDQQRADRDAAQDIEHVEYEDLPRAARQALGKEAEGASDVDYMRVTSDGQAAEYIVQYTPRDGKRQQLWVDQSGKVISGPKPTRYQPEDRDTTARSQDLERTRRDRERNREDGDARPAADRAGNNDRAGGGGNMGTDFRKNASEYLDPIEEGEVPKIVRVTTEKESGQSFDELKNPRYFRVGEDDYGIQFDKGGARQAIRIDRSGKVITPLHELKRGQRNDQSGAEYFDPIEVGEVPRAVRDTFTRESKKTLEDARYFRIGESDYLLAYNDEGKRYNIRIARDGEVVNGPREVRASNRAQR